MQDLRKLKIVTNNPLVAEKLKDTMTVEYLKKTYREVLVTVRDYLHGGYRLLSHPLSGSIKPNETPYKSVVISTVSEAPNFDEIRIMEESILTCDKFAVKYPILPDHVADDFQMVDYKLITGALTL